MSTPNPNSTTERALQILTAINTTAPIAMGGVAALISIFKQAGAEQKTNEEIEAQWQESMDTALRTREKSLDQMSDRP
jgi:hypothetical protein